MVCLRLDFIMNENGNNGNRISFGRDVNPKFNFQQEISPQSMVANMFFQYSPAQDSILKRKELLQNNPSAKLNINFEKLKVICPYYHLICNPYSFVGKDIAVTGDDLQNFVVVTDVVPEVQTQTAFVEELRKQDFKCYLRSETVEDKTYINTIQFVNFQTYIANVRQKKYSNFLNYNLYGKILDINKIPFDENLPVAQIINTLLSQFISKPEK